MFHSLVGILALLCGEEALIYRGVCVLSYPISCYQYGLTGGGVGREAWS